MIDVFVLLIIAEVTAFVVIFRSTRRCLFRIANAFAIGCLASIIRNVTSGPGFSDDALKFALIHGATLAGLAAIIHLCIFAARSIQRRRCVHSTVESETDEPHSGH